MRKAIVAVMGLAGCHRVFDLERDVDAPPTVDAPSAYTQAVLDDGPVAYLRLGEAGGVECEDVVADGPIGTILGGVTLGAPGAIAAESNTAASFDGKSAAISLGNVFGFEGTQAFTLEAWIKPVFTGHFQEVMSRWVQPPGRNGWTLYISDALLGFERDTNNTITSLVEYTGLAEGVYSHIVATFDGSSLTLFVNGVQKNTKVAPIALGAVPVPLLVGAANGNPGNSPFAGTIDEVAISPHALTVQRIFEHFTLGTRP